MTEPRVVIVDDHELFRSGVRAELELPRLAPPTRESRRSW